MKNGLIAIAIFAFFVLNSCKKTNEENPIIKIEKISGQVQKGPFISGSAISISELTNDFTQTGKVFNTQITDNKGTFEISNIELVSNYVSLRADGFYFNEISGKQSAAQLTLDAISDISDRKTININVLSRLEKPRVEFLLSKGVSFSEAKSQAQAEVLLIFNIQENDMRPSELLDISKEGNDNAILLAISAILQGSHTEAELSETLSNIANDLEEDGVLTNTSLGSKLINQAILLDEIAIKNNLQQYYSELGEVLEIPNFEKYITHFIENAQFEITEILIEKISGQVQKGPFISGSGISIYELTNDFTQTGKVFNTQITNNKGTFEVSDIELVSNYVSLRADGFYYNEVFGRQSLAQITLEAICDISDKNKININILSRLEKPRVEYLISNGTPFSEAKSQAQAEVLLIFNIQEDDIRPSELLDISEEGNDNAILLATSVILQGYRTEGELTELLSNIATDLKEDGILSNTTLGSKLINDAVYLDTVSIKNNLQQRYEELGEDFEIPDFGKYVGNFIENTQFEITESLIEYPATGVHGENILDIDKLDYSSRVLSMATHVATGTKVRIEIHHLNGIGWAHLAFDFGGWEKVTVDNKLGWEAIGADQLCDMQVEFFPGGHFLIKYFEMGAAEPTRSKILEF